jgi:two-component system, LytTR family, sensor kinase
MLSSGMLPLAVRRTGSTALWVLLASSLAALLMSLHIMAGQTWAQVLRASLAFCYAWGALSMLILAVDRHVMRRDHSLAVGLAWHLPGSVIVSGLSAYVVPAFSVLLSVPGHPFSLSLEPLRQAQRWGIASQMILYGAIVGAGRAVHYYARFQERAVRALELEKLLVQSQLQALRMQLEPHFLFNALNTISAHVESDPRAARRMIEELGELLRFSLESHEKQEVPLSEELALLNRYLAIQRARFEDRLRIELDVPAEALEAYVPSQLLQPLVENALRHGLAPRAAGGCVRIEAARRGSELRLRVVDDGVGLAGGSTQGTVGRGLWITRQRLARLYPGGRARLDIRNGVPSGAIVEVTVPWRTDLVEESRGMHDENASAQPLDPGR